MADRADEEGKIISGPSKGGGILAYAYVLEPAPNQESSLLLKGILARTCVL